MDGGSSERPAEGRDVLKATGRGDPIVSPMAKRFAATSKERLKVVSEAPSRSSGGTLRSALLAVPGAGEWSRVLRFFEACGVMQVLLGLDSPTAFGLEVRRVLGSWRGCSSERRRPWFRIRDSGVLWGVGFLDPVSRSSDGRLVEAVGGEGSGCSSSWVRSLRETGSGEAGCSGSSGRWSTGGVGFEA
jgi:hypothetical protein